MPDKPSRRSADPDSPLASLDDRTRTALFELVAEGPSVLEEFIGKRHHSRTLLRWALKGVGTVKLKSVTAGRKRYTSRAWLLRFFEESEAERRA